MKPDGVKGGLAGTGDPATGYGPGWNTRLLPFSSGFLAMISQVALLRELAVVFRGMELVYVLAVGAWLIWSAAGAGWSRSDKAGAGIPVEGLAGIHAISALTGMALILPLALAIIRLAPILTAETTGVTAALWKQAGLAAVTLMPSGFLAGRAFQWAVLHHMANGGTLALAYAWECAGALAGAVLSFATAAAGCRNGPSAVTGAFLVILAIRVVAGAIGRRFTGIAVLVLAVVMAASPVLEDSLTRWVEPRVVAVADSPLGRVLVTRWAGQTAFFVNGALVAHDQDHGAEFFVHAALAQRERPGHVFLAGGLAGGAAMEVDREVAGEAVGERAGPGPTSLTLAETDPVFVRLIREYAPHRYAPVNDREKVRLVTGDPRRLLQDECGLDAILLAMPPPESAGANRFFTRDFFQTAAHALEPGGILAFSLPAGENLRTPLARERDAALFRALTAVFADVLVLPGEDLLFLASDRPLVRDPAVLSRRLAERGLATRSPVAELLAYRLSNDRFAAVNAPPGPGPVNTDTEPVCFRYSALMWLSRFFPSLALWDPARNGNALPVSLFVTLAVVILVMVAAAMIPACRRSRRERMGLLAAWAAGFGGMVAENLLLLRYQTLHGLLYRDVGLLLFPFMAGMTLGARWGRKRGMAEALTVPLLAGVWFPPDHPLLIGAAQALCGTLAGALFVRAAPLSGTGASAPGPPLAADLLGGAVGAAVGGLILTPFFGMEVSAGTAAGSFLLALVLTWRPC